MIQKNTVAQWTIYYKNYPKNKDSINETKIFKK